jgi:hypothetical protein
MHIVSLHSAWSSYHRHASLDSFERCRQLEPGLLPGEKITRGFRISYGLRELIEWIAGWGSRIQSFLRILDGILSLKPLTRVLFLKLDMIPQEEEQPVVPIFVEDEEDMNWEEDSQNILKRTPNARFAVFTNHANSTPLPRKLRDHVLTSVDTRKPWLALERQIRSLFPDPEPILYRLRRQRVATFTVRENKVYILRRNGAGDGEIDRLFGLNGNQRSRILAALARKLGVHEAEIANFEAS